MKGFLFSIFVLLPTVSVHSFVAKRARPTNTDIWGLPANQNDDESPDAVALSPVRSYLSSMTSHTCHSDKSLQPPESNSRRRFLTAAAGATATVNLSVNVNAAVAADVANENKTPSVPSSNGVPGINSVLDQDSVIAAMEGTAPVPAVDFEAILQKASRKALGGGKAGAAAAVVQVCSLMWLRTAMNYQYRYGGDLGSSLRTLTAEGGIPRLYQGLPFALVQGPLTRFGDTAANVGVLALLESIPETSNLPLPLKTACGSIAAGLWRIVLMPVDTSKTAMQVEGADGLNALKQKVLEEGPVPLYQGALASAAATAAGHFPWFLTYNALNDALPAVGKEEVFLTLVRSAFLGLSASCVSDCCSNSLRVIKTTKQTAALNKETLSLPNGTEQTNVETLKELSYREALSLVLEKDGVSGLFGRGLQTRLLTNAIQGAAFSVLWKYFQTVGGVQ